MPEFISGQDVSTFPSENILFNSASGITGQKIRENDLLNQGKQLDLSNANMEQVARASAGLLSAYPDEASRAAAYPRVVGMLQSQGFAKQAPATYPGEAVLRSLVNQGVPVADQYRMGLITSPGQQANFNAVFGTQPPTTPGTGAGATPAGTTATPAAGQGPSFAGGIAGFESGGVSNPPENPRWPVAKGGPAGPHQFIASTWNSFAQANPDLFKGMTPDQILAARTDTTPVGPNGEDRSTLATNWYAGENAKVLQASNIAPTPTNLGIAHALGAGGATKVLSAPDTTPLSQVIPETIPQNPEYGRMTVGDLKQRYARLGPVGGSGTATASATPATAPAGGGGTPGRVQVASVAPTTATDGTTAAPVAPTVSAPASGAAPAAAPPAATTAPPQPVQPTAAPTGTASPQFQRAMLLERQAAMLEAGPGGQLPQNKAMADYLHTQAKAILGTDTFQQIGGGMQRNVLTGETKYNGPPTARSTTDNDGNTWILAPGQPPTMLHANVSGVTGSGPEASALRTMNEIAPKIQAGIPLTPQEQANYASATEIYRNPTFVEDTNTGKKVRAYTRDLPPNFPPPPAAGAQPSAESQVVIPGMAPGTKKAEEGLGADFATTDKKSYDTANASLGMLVNANNAAEVMNRTPGSWSAPGAGANTRLELAKTLNTVSGLFGGGPVVDPAQISAWEALNKQTRLMGMQVVNSYFGGSREAASIINGATSAVPNSENSYLGFRLVSSGIEQDLLRQKELYEYKAQRVAANQPLVTAEAEFNKANPVQTYTARAIANAVPDDIAAHLVANPDTVKAFDQHFGPGIGEFILKGGRSGMGRAGVPSNG